jgi:drug/metabolite transporter (DMT)-like permease
MEGMAVLLALVGAVTYGVADFWGGLATKRTAVTAVIATGELAGLVVLVPALALLPARFDVAAVLWGAGAGVAGGLGLLLFYRSLADGTMSVVAPLTAVSAAAVPVLVGLALGERASVLALVGVVVALLAVVLVSAEGGRLPTGRQLVADRSVGEALAAGVAFGLFFVLLSRPAHDTGLWPAAGARVASLALMVAVALPARRRLLPSRPALPLVLASGITDMSANILFLLASREGLLVITSVLTALYPASTVLLAQLVLRERIHRLQVAGLAAAAAAVTLIAVA